MSNQSTEITLAQAYNLMEEGNLAQARPILYDAIEFDLDNKELHFAYWCCNFWIPHLDTESLLSNLDKGNRILARWIEFSETLEEEDKNKASPSKIRPQSHPRAVYATKHGVFSLALASFKAVESTLIDDQTVTIAQKSDVLSKIGICYKELGEYDSALEYLKIKANALSPNSAAIYAEMADCFALSGEEKQAKLFFREAFFLDAQKIELAFLESQLIRAVIEQAKTKGGAKGALLEWIPVYGELTHVFNIKHEFRLQEVGKLQQDIYARENELKDPSNSPQILVPKLINMYFRLIDHYERSTDASAAQKSQECQLQIRSHDEDIYNIYTANKSLTQK